eukprot:3005083-Prymnesium_polylepis.1
MGRGVDRVNGVERGARARRAHRGPSRPSGCSSPTTTAPPPAAGCQVPLAPAQGSRPSSPQAASLRRPHSRRWPPAGRAHPASASAPPASRRPAARGGARQPGRARAGPRRRAPRLQASSAWGELRTRRCRQLMNRQH